MNIERLLPVQEKRQSFKGVRFVGFDLDGTLLQEPKRSFPEVFARKTVRLFQIPQDPTKEFATSSMGTATTKQLASLPDAIGLPTNHLIRLLSTDLRDFIAHAIDNEFFNQPTELFSDVLPILKELKKQGVRLFISSSRPTENIFTLLHEHPELAEVIDFAIGKDPHNPALAKGEGHFRAVANHFHIPFEQLVRESVFIGDTASDVRAGKSIGAKTIGRTSTKSQQELREAGATLVVNNFSSLPNLFASERKIPSENIYKRR